MHIFFNVEFSVIKTSDGGYAFVNLKVEINFKMITQNVECQKNSWNVSVKLIVLCCIKRKYMRILYKN